MDEVKCQTFGKPQLTDMRKILGLVLQDKVAQDTKGRFCNSPMVPKMSPRK